MKRLLLYLVIPLCAVASADADEAIRSLQQTLKDQGFYYGKITGDKSAETTTAIRRYQIRNALQVTGELNEETLRSVRPSSKSVATEFRQTSKPAGVQPDSVRPDVSTRLTQNSPPSSVTQPDRLLPIDSPYSASFYQPAPVRVNRRIIAGAQYQLMSRGYYRGRVDGSYGRQTAFAVRAFQSSAGLSPTGRLDMQTLEALGSPESDIASLGPGTRGDETWMPVRKFKNGSWKLKWKRHYRTFGGQDGEEAQQANRDPAWNPYNHD